MENVFVRISDIPGEAKEANHIEWIAVKSIDWGLERTLDMTDLGTTQRGYANANFNKVTLTSELSRASAKLMTAVANGTSRGEITIEMCRAGSGEEQGMEAYLIWTLKHAIVDSYTVNGGEEQIPEESWTLAYRHIEIKYLISDYNTGELSDENSFVWNLETGKVG